MNSAAPWLTGLSSAGFVLSAGFVSFAEYLSSERAIGAFGILTRHRATQMMNSARVLRNLDPADGNPMNERIARALSTLEPVRQREVWSAVVKDAARTGERISAELVERQASMFAAGPSGRVDDGNPGGQQDDEPSPDVYLSSLLDSWYTPATFVRRVKQVAPEGVINLDVCSDERANRAVLVPRAS